MRRVISTIKNNPVLKGGISTSTMTRNVLGTVEFILIGTSYYSIIIDDYFKLVKTGIIKKRA